MAYLYADASISPTKEELLAAWLPTQPWGGAVAKKVGAYRFDDPAGQVGTETFLVATDDGRTLHVPVTYRDAPLGGVEPITTMEHTALGRRWVYDGCVDPVYVTALLGAVLAGAPQAVEEYDRDGVRHTRTPRTVVTGAGTAGTVVPPVGELAPVSDAVSTTLTIGDLALVLVRVVPLADPAGATLTGTWPGQDEPLVLAAVRGA